MLRLIGSMLPMLRQSLKKKKTATISVLILVTAFFVFGFTAPALAQGNAFGLEYGAATGLGGDDIRLTIAKLIRAFLGILGIVVLVLIIYAGYEIMMAGGNEEKVSVGRKRLVNTVIGLLIIMSSLAIVQFFINILGGATNFLGFGGNGGVSFQRQTFAGSGAMGDVVKDHYPFRDQTEVPRNTKISVTFSEPVDPSSFINDKSNNNIFGDCSIPSGQTAAVCDTLKNNIIKIYKDDDTDTNLAADAVTALAVYEGGAPTVYASGVPETNTTSSVKTIVLAPVEWLGDKTRIVPYTVDLTNGIKKKYNPNIGGISRQPGIFDGTRYSNYAWNFITSVNADLTPPTVENIYPVGNGEGEGYPRNSILQITFSEAVDPSTAQGLAGVFTNVIFNSSLIKGEWKVSNAYRTMEFLSNIPCGGVNRINSCGDPMYCLPPGDFRSLVRTSVFKTGTNSAPFESILPYAGLVDMAGNGLDGNENGIPNQPPRVSGVLRNNFQDDETNAAFDNSFWDFKIDDFVDTVAPYVTQMTPGIDNENVAANANTKIYFSKIMWYSTLYGIGIEEYDGQTAPTDIDRFWYRPTAKDVGNKTEVNFDHRMYGPNRNDYYYFTKIPSTVKSATQNCLYPGVGPYDTAKSQGVSPECVPGDDPANCNQAPAPTSSRVFLLPGKDTGCMQTHDSNKLVTASTTECIEIMKQLSPVSPRPSVIIPASGGSGTIFQ